MKDFVVLQLLFAMKLQGRKCERAIESSFPGEQEQKRRKRLGAKKEADTLEDQDNNIPKTRAMERALRQEISPTELIAGLPQNMLRSYLVGLMGKRGISTDALAELAALNRSSLYKILNGATKHPQRNVLLRLALVLRLSFEETQQLLYYGGCAQLSGNRAKDIIVSNGIIRGSSIDEVNSHLKAHYFADLFSKE